MKALVALLALSLARTAVADGKQTLAIVIDPKAGAIKMTDAVVVQIRVLAGRKAERFRVAVTDKATAAVSRAAECKAIEPACAAKIGAQLGVEYVLSGEVESRGQHLVLVAGLVKVETKTRVRSVRDIAAAETPAKKWAQRVYERVIAADTGDLTIVANARRGDVLLDGQLVAALFDGKTTLTGIAVGAHELGIRAPGYKPLDVDVTIEGATRENLLLEPAP
jgi:hypothetical protein